MLSNSEVWYSLTKKDTDLVEQIDEMWMRNLFECSRNVAKDLLYLELRVVPISFIIKARKQMYLHHILQRPENFLPYRFLIAQLKSPTNNDWSSKVLQEQEQEVEIPYSLEDIIKMSKSKFKSVVQSITKQKALTFFMEKKESKNSENSEGKLLH